MSVCWRSEQVKSWKLVAHCTVLCESTSEIWTVCNERMKSLCWKVDKSALEGWRLYITRLKGLCHNPGDGYPRPTISWSCCEKIHVFLLISIISFTFHTYGQCYLYPGLDFNFSKSILLHPELYAKTISWAPLT